MADDVLNFKVCSPLKLRSCLTGKCHAICHYSYNLPLAVHMLERKPDQLNFTAIEKKKNDKRQRTKHKFSSQSHKTIPSL